MTIINYYKMTEETSNGIEEEWKLITAYPNYELSNLGRIRNIKYGRILKPISYQNGYLVIWLSNGQWQIRKQYPVHRLVAQACIGKPENKK